MASVSTLLCLGITYKFLYLGFYAYSETTSKVIVKKKTSRYSVYDPDMPSVSGSPQHYGEVTNTRTPQPTRAVNRGMKGEKLKNMYNSPHLSK